MDSSPLKTTTAVGMCFVHHPFHDFQPIDVGQLQIEDQQVDIATFQPAEGFAAGAAVFDACVLRPPAVAGTSP
jgi:hypothetical protein